MLIPQLVPWITGMPHTITPAEACTKSFVCVLTFIIVSTIVCVGVPFIWMHRDYTYWVQEPEAWGGD